MSNTAADDANSPTNEESESTTPTFAFHVQLSSSRGYPVRSVYLDEVIGKPGQKAPTLVALQQAALQLTVDEESSINSDDYTVTLSHATTEGTDWWMNIDSDQELLYAMGFFPPGRIYQALQQHKSLCLKALLVSKNAPYNALLPPETSPTTPAATTIALETSGSKSTAPRKRAATPKKLANSVQTKVTPSPRKKTPAKHARPTAATTKGSTHVEQRILRSLAELHSVGITTPLRQLILVFSGYKHMQSKGFVRAITALTSQGYVTTPSGKTFAVTDKGLAVAGPGAATSPPTTADVHARLQTLLSVPKSHVLFQLLADGRPMARETIMVRMGYKHQQSKGFVNAIAELKNLGIAEDTNDGVSKGKMLQLTHLAFPFGRPNQGAATAGAKEE